MPQFISSGQPYARIQIDLHLQTVMHGRSKTTVTLSHRSISTAVDQTEAISHPTDRVLLSARLTTEQLTMTDDRVEAAVTEATPLVTKKENVPTTLEETIALLLATRKELAESETKMTALTRGLSETTDKLNEARDKLQLRKLPVWDTRFKPAMFLVHTAFWVPLIQYCLFYFEVITARWFNIAASIFLFVYATWGVFMCLRWKANRELSYPAYDHTSRGGMLMTSGIIALVFDATGFAILSPTIIFNTFYYVQHITEIISRIILEDKEKGIETTAGAAARKLVVMLIKWIFCMGGSSEETSEGEVGMENENAGCDDDLSAKISDEIVRKVSKEVERQVKNAIGAKYVEYPDDNSV